MDARRLRFGAMLAATLGVVGLALALGASRDGEQAGAQGAVPTTAQTTLPANPPTCTATTLGGSRAANAALAADCDALLAMESTLAGTGTLNWAPGLALGSWEGVAVGGTPKRVTQIVIHGGKRMSRLSGTLPTQLGNLGGLTWLDLNGNRLRGADSDAAGETHGTDVPGPGGQQRAEPEHPPATGGSDGAGGAGPVGEPSDGEHPDATGGPDEAAHARPLRQHPHGLRAQRALERDGERPSQATAGELHRGIRREGPGGGTGNLSAGSRIVSTCLYRASGVADAVCIWRISSSV